jgi:AraC-like DNA-binding protein
MREPPAHPHRLTTDHWLGGGDGLAVLEHVLHEKVSLHWHEFFELSYVTAGSGEHVINGVRRPLGAGDVLALTPADFHEVRPLPGEALTIVNVIYTDDVLPPQLRSTLPGPPTLRLPELAGDFARMLADSRLPGALPAMALRATLTRIIADVARAAPRPPAGASQPTDDGRADVLRALHWIDHHFREPVRLADAARVACLSPHHFSAMFRRTTGMPFQEYLIGRRLQFARGLLAASRLPVTEVCHAAGFRDLTHFSRSYRRRFGSAPSTHRGRAGSMAGAAAGGGGHPVQ